jgi:6-phosphogluconolactonase
VTAYFYVASAVTGDIAAYRLDPAAGRVEQAAITRADDTVASLAISPRRGRLYAVLRGRPAIATFALDRADGSLSELAVAPAPGPLAYLLLSADEQWLFGASYHDSMACAHPVDDHGVAGPAPRPALSLGTGARCHAVAEAADGTLWVSALGHDRLYPLRHDPATGELAPLGFTVELPPGTGPRHLALYPGRDRLAVITERTAQVVSLPVGEPGAVPYAVWDALPDEVRLAPGLVRVPGQEYPAADPESGLPWTWAADLALSADGELAVTSERSSSTVSVLSARTGELLSWTRSEEQPRGLALDPSGEFLLVTGERSTSVSLYRIGDGGRALDLADRAPAPPGLMWAEPAGL